MKPTQQRTESTPRNVNENFAELYVNNLRALYSKSVDGSTQESIYDGFTKIAVPFNTVDWNLSRELAKKYKCKLKMCYNNALDIAHRDSRFAYCEGYATSVIPMEHAWLVDTTREGIIVDPTWVLSPFERNDAYYGIVLPVDDVIIARIENEWEPSWLPTVLKGQK